MNITLMSKVCMNWHLPANKRKQKSFENIVATHCFPNSQIVVLAETPNAICHYNYLRERGCIEVNPERVRHFRLGRNLRHQDLLGIQDA